MSKIYTHEDRFLVLQVKELLEHYKIPCFVKNEYSVGAAGDLSPFDCWPEVWLTDDEWVPRASKLIDDWKASLRSKQDWVCNHCQETNDGHFEICWNCGRPAE